MAGGWRDIVNGIAEDVDLGAARLLRDPRRKGGWTLLVEEVQQSYVDVRDPTYLSFEYTRRIGSIVDTVAPAGRPIRVLHLGGGAFTMPRYIEATRPGSAQVVVERDRRLADFVQRILPLGFDLEIVFDDARSAVAGWRAEDFDLVIGDVYVAAQMPESVSDVTFAASVARVLRPEGIYAVNVADLAPLAFSRSQAATLRTAFDDVCLVVRPELLRGRRFGNVVFAAALRAGRLPVARLAAIAGCDRQPAQVVSGAGLDLLTEGAVPVVLD
ncbi:fused MFS/spermidine synthase [Dactylosporangium fulvum]|uniref:Fused MFS/spermidine synthase n=1 Tax=Dactylosporangium fulvum TaxID=53359 RepID=A0ABY5VSS1_9ACTN|nr:fused MFS/spermidine synthase [Dactylosporangium fulvum]UWP80783.1 fused MFS/spermidine synthase [Dactylosporangium fulvum]